MNSNNINSRIEEIENRYQSDSILKRARRMVVGLRMPRCTREHKEALIEVQRLAAPVCAVLLPVLALLLLMVFSTDTRSRPLGPVVDLETEKPDIPELTDVKPEFTDSERNSLSDLPDDIADFKPPNPVVKPAEAPPPVQPVDSPRSIPKIATGPRITWSDPGQRKARVRETPKNASEKNVMLALRWLRKNQNPDGSWNRNKSAMTGLAILTFLAHAETPGDSDEFGDAVLAGLRFLMDGQNPQSGLYGDQDGNQYSHPIATYAMCEAYGMTLNPDVKASAERALVPIIKGQHPTGGWTYRMEPGVDPASGTYRDDTSYMGWCVQALKAAKMAGLKADGLDRAFKKAVNGFERNAAPNGGFGYTGPSATHGLTSVGTLCMEMLGAGGDSRVRKSLAIMDKWTIGSFDGPNRVGKSPQYYFYYATQSKFNNGGQSWNRWDSEMVEIYTGAQKIQRGVYRDHLGESHDIGWWENGDAHTDRPVMDTCLAALQLMVYYRNLPTYQQKAFRVEPEIMALVRDPEDITVREGDRL